MNVIQTYILSISQSATYKLTWVLCLTFMLSINIIVDSTINLLDVKVELYDCLEEEPTQESKKDFDEKESEKDELLRGQIHDRYLFLYGHSTQFPYHKVQNDSEKEIPQPPPRF